MADLLVRTTGSSSFSLLGGGSGARLETVIWTAKLVVLSVGVVSTFLLFKVAVIPCLLDFTLSLVPRVLSCIKTWLSPPYIYIIVNFIIISIAASNSFQSQATPAPTSKPSVVEDEEKNFGGGQDLKKLEKLEQAEEEDSADLISKDVVSFFSTNDNVTDEIIFDDEPQLAFKREVISVTTPLIPDACTYSENLPPAEEEDGDDSYDDTLDATWKAIIEGNGTVRRPVLKKSDTWNAHAPPPLMDMSNDLEYYYLMSSSQKPTYNKPEMRKSETFNDRGTTLKTAGRGEEAGSLRREMMLSGQDSLNQRVEAFIKKFNNDMRVERQESDLRYMKMVKQEGI